MPPKKAVKYELNDKLLCKYGDFYYEGKIVNVSEANGERYFTVHYQGWHKRHDVVISESSSRQLFLPFTEENYVRAKAELKQARLEKKRKGSSRLSTASVTSESSSTVATSPSAPVDNSPVVAPPPPPPPPPSRPRPRRPPPAPPRNVPKREFIQDVDAIKYHYGCLPSSLQSILDKDNDAVMRRRLLTKLPAAYPIDVLLYEFLCATYDIEIAWGREILTISYGDDISSNFLNSILGACQMVTDYFNMMLGKLLLYAPERDQYQSELLRQRLLNLNDSETHEIRPHLGSVVLPDKSVPVRHSSVYGLPHLLRLFDCLSKKLASVPQDSEPIVSLKLMTAELVIFLDENREKYFSVRRDYEPQE